MSRSVVRYVGIAALGAGSLALAALATYTALPAIFATSPKAVEQIAPNDPLATYRSAALRYATRPGRLPERDYSQALHSAALTPLSADPFALIATRAIADRDFARAIRLLEESRHRNPRQRLARLLLLERYIRQNRPREAGFEAAVLGRLMPEAGGPLMNVLVTMAMDPTAANAVALAMRGEVQQGPLLQELVARGAPTSLVLRMAQGWRPLPSDSAGVWRTSLLNRLVNEGRYAEARGLWRRVGGGHVAGENDPIFNIALDQSSALPPFNWQLASNETGAAEITRRHVLTVDYFGRRSGQLVGQLTSFSAGPHKLLATIEGAANGQGSKLVWFVRCAVAGKPADAGRVLMSVPLSGISGGGRRVRVGFTVPTDCTAQWMTIDGIAAEFPTTQSVEIRNIALESGTAQ